MAMNVTNIDQSRKLLEFGIDPSTADCLWVYDHTEKRYFPHFKGFYGNIVSSDNNVPAWSLSALLDLMPSEVVANHFLTLEKEGDGYCCCYEDINGNSFHHFFAENPIDAVFEMVCWFK